MTVRLMRMRVPTRFRIPVPLLAVAVLAIAGVGVASAATGPANVGSTAPAVSTIGAGGWKVLSSATAIQTGQAISAPGFDTGGWLSVTPDDAGAPGTEITALLQNGKCPNVFYADTMKTCLGSQKKNGPVTTAQFAVPWWFRADFTPDLRAGQSASLVVNGVVGAADVWVNGKELATQATVTGAYTRFTFDLTGVVRSGTNSVALEVHPNDPTKMFTLDDVDWNQIPPDNNTGIQFPVQLHVSGAVKDTNAHVVQNTAADLSSSALTVKTDVTNTTGSSQSATVTATVTPPGGGSPITVSQSVTVAAKATQTVTFTPAQNAALTITHPQIWWPYQMGDQPLYTLTTSVSVGGAVSDSTSETFGIRTVTSSLIGKGGPAPSGSRSFSINGRQIVLRGGGFAGDLFLRYSSADIARQIAILKNMGVNTLRLEGHFMPEDFYQQMDRAGILIYAGFQCCDAWELPSGGDAILQNTALTIGQNARNHPSVFTVSWSDEAPTSAQETDTLTGFQQADFTVPVIASAEYKSTSKLGPSGMKEGPYDYVPPIYWYDTAHAAGSDQTNSGGSWALDTEESAGDTVPTLDSINRFLSPSDQAALWQKPDFNQYHANYEPGHGGYKFGTLFLFDQALTNRYGKWTGLNGYVQEAQIQNYENTRAQFEAFLAHSTNAVAPSTGTIYWQINKGWPTLLWDLYNYDGDQAGSFFGAKKANRSVHALYELDSNKVTLDNLSGTTQSGLSVQSKVYNTAGTVLDDQTASGLDLTSQQVRNGILTPKVPTATGTTFVELVLRQGGAVVDRNVYWIPAKQDAVDWSKTIGNPSASFTSYANMQDLQALPASSISVTASSQSQPGPGGADTVAKVTVTNTSTKALAFFLRADVRRGTAAGTELSGDNQVTSALWDDNDITLFPGESQALNVSYRSADLRGATPVVSVYGSNATKIDVVADAGGGGDHQPPTVPGNVHTTPVAAGSVGLAWDASTDDVAVTGYDVYRDGTLLATVTGTSTVDSAVSASTTYSYVVRAKDAAGNSSDPSTALSVATPGTGGPTSYEAEAASLGGGARVSSCAHCSGGRKVVGVGNGGTVTFTGVGAATAGTYTMTVDYQSPGGSRSAVVTVDGVAQTVVFAQTASGSAVASTTVTVTLKAGSNTIVFGNPSAAAPNLDRVVV
jgi:exo-1,4-beta-D-glucosaminidase